MSTCYDVIVVGAGPTGIALATLLGQRGVRVALIERHHDVYHLPRAAHLDDEVYRILHELGIGEEFAGVTRPALGLRLVDERHRELATFVREPMTAGGLPQANMFDQPDLERLMHANVQRYPEVEIRAGHEVLGVEPRVRDVRVRVTGDGGEHRTLVAPYVVGCDGANSVVRDALRVDNHDLGFDQRWLVVDVRCDIDLPAWDGVHQVCDPRRAGTYMRIGPDRYRWEFQLLDGETADDYGSLAALRGILEPWLAGVPDGRIDVIRSAEYTFRARVAKRWRIGRVFLAGDAAHLTPPFIGQGMCAGLRDAQNLAWKLASAVEGDNGAALLDSYEAERKPHATAMVKKAVTLGRIMTGGGRAAALARRVLLPKLSRLGPVRDAVLDTRTPALRAGPMVDRATPRALRGTQLPLVRLPDPGAHDVLIDRLLGTDPAIVAVRGVDPATVAESDDLTWLTVDPAASDGERLLAQWLRDGGVAWAKVDPDRVVRVAGRAVGAR